MSWIAEYWYVVWALVCLAGIIAAGTHFWRNPEATGARIFFLMFPFADPTGRTPTGFTPRALVLWLMGLLILVLASLLVPGFK